MTEQRVYQCAAVALVLAGLTALVAVSMGRTGGMLVYTIDDPYIHLAVAENILRGGYGVNGDAFSAPSSSILYPFLLAGLLALGIGDWSPLLLAGLGSLITAWLLGGIVWRAVTPTNWRGVVFASLVIAPLLLAVNAFALPLTGMEHTLHMAASVAVVIGLYDLSRDAPVGKSFLLGTIFAPLLRYEGLALVLPVLLALLLYRKFAAAALVAATLAVAFGAFSYMLYANGQPVLPSSVLVKSRSISSAMEARVDSIPLLEIAKGFGHNIIRSIVGRHGTLFGVGIALMVLGVARPGPKAPSRLIVAFTVGIALSGHIVVGHYGWFSRYEVYGMAMMLAALILIYAEFWRDAARSIFFRSLGTIIFLTLLAGEYSVALFRSPAASHNIYVQQFQMHRFATEFFPQTVAVNDLGYVSYRNDLKVLDLWGLGSEEARLASIAAGGHSPEFLAQMTENADAKYAMIYAEWFPGGVPEGWCHIATLHTVKVSAAFPNVDFYLVDPTYLAEMAAALDAFAPTLPAPARLERKACPST